MTEQTPIATASSTKPKFKSRLAYTMALALLLFAVLPVSVMGLAGYLQTRSLLEKQTAYQFYNIAHNQTIAFDQAMKTKEIRLELLNRRSAFLEAAEELMVSESVPYQEQLFEEFDNVNRSSGRPLFNDFFILNSDGVIYAASDNTWKNVSLRKSPIYHNFAEKGSISAYNLNPIFSNEFIIFTVVPIRSKTGKELGLLVGTTKSDAMRNFLEETTFFNPASSAYIVSTNNTYLGIDPYTEELEAFSPSAEQEKAIGLSPLPPSNETTLEFKNHLNSSVVSQVHEIESIGIKIVLEIPRDIAYGQLSNLALFSITLFLVTLLILGITLWYASMRIVKPLQALSDTTRKFTEGDWQVRSAITRKDEIGALAYSFNEMADELSSLYRSLKHQVDERTEYINTASEVAQSIATTFNLDELLDKTTRLIVEHFDYYHAGIFMIGRTGKTASLKAAYGPSASEMLEREHYLEVGSESIVGWVSANNKPRAASDVGDDPVHFKNDLLPNTRAEVGIPIATGNTVLGVLDVQSTHSESFDTAKIAALATLANQIATAIQNVSLFESSDVNLHELDRLYRASRDIAQEKTAEGVLDITGRILHDSPFITTIFTSRNRGINIFSTSDPDYHTDHFNLPEFLDIPLERIVGRIKSEDVIIDISAMTPFPKDFIDVLRKIGAQAISLIPVMQGENTVALVVIGARSKEHLSQTAVQPYINLVEMISITLDKIQASELTELRLSEMEAISITNQATAAAQDLDSLYPVLHEQVRQIIGDYPFIIAIYDDISDTIHIPYSYEGGKVSSIPSFPLGEGLTSIIVHTGQPLMIVENTEERSAALGVRLVGKPVKSWLGSPLHMKGKIIGAIIIQDTENEKSFDENSLRFINTLASQVSGAIYNIQLLEDSRQRTIQLESAAEIARDISGSLHLDELLGNAVTMLIDRFDFYHASIFLVDALGEYAVIREATGEAGAQLKRNGYKLGIGSKSIVGYVSKRGETLVINDTDKDATYYANPLLPNTRAEAAIPLKVGERILGTLDVQSIRAYAFPEEVLQTLSIIADQLAVAVINTELFAETQEHLSQHRLLHHITTSAASGTTIEEALRGAVQGLQVSLGGDRVAILLLDNTQENLYIGAAMGFSEEDQKTLVPINSGITGWVARNRKLLRIRDVQSDPRYLAVSTNTHSELALPLIFRKELLGVLNVESEQVGAYSKEDEEMLGTLAGSLAAIIANARLLQQVRRQAERERTLREITGKIRRSTNIQTILATTAKEITKAVGAQHAQVKIDLRLDDNNTQRK